MGAAHSDNLYAARAAGWEGTVLAFDINDRSTWAWREDEAISFIDGCAVDPTSEYHFYQTTATGPVRFECPPGCMYNPSATPGPICEPSGMREQQINQDVYQWCLDHGIVTEDQR